MTNRTAKRARMIPLKLAVLMLFLSSAGINDMYDSYQRPHEPQEQKSLRINRTKKMRELRKDLYRNNASDTSDAIAK